MNLKIRKVLICFFVLIVVFFISLVITYICMPLNGDSVWLYGFGYNIYDGLIIYRDFNVVTTPLYYFFEVLFIHLFGNYMISVDLFNSLLVSLIALMMFRTIKFKSFLVLPLIMIFYPNGYNLFSLFWLMLILFLIEIQKDNDVLIGLIISFLFLTKQSIGVFILIPGLFYSKNKIKMLSSFCVPVLLLMVYLIYNDALYSFIDYCFLGLFDFGAKNLSGYSMIIILECFVLAYLIYLLVKSNFKKKDVFYILMFQIMIYPLAEIYHFCVYLFPIIYYVLKTNGNKYFSIILGFTIIYLSIFCFFGVGKKIHFEKDLLFFKNSGDLTHLLEVFNDYLVGVDNYYFSSSYAYLYKLYYHIPITHYDLWNEGNMGYNGVFERIKEVDEMCSSEKCVFILDSTTELIKQNQDSDFYFYVKNNYVKIDEYDIFHIYSN